MAERVRFHIPSALGAAIGFFSPHLAWGWPSPGKALFGFAWAALIGVTVDVILGTPHTNSIEQASPGQREGGGDMTNEEIFWGRKSVQKKIPPNFNIVWMGISFVLILFSSEFFIIFMKPRSDLITGIILCSIIIFFIILSYWIAKALTRP